jgi:hypothetical protein
MGRIAFWDEEAQSGGEQRPCHLRKCEEKQAPAAERVDCPNGRPSKDKVDEAEAKRSNECFSLSGVCLSENRTGVESNDVDCLYSAQIEQEFMLCHLLPHICCAIMTTKEARVARRTRGIVKSSIQRWK